MGEFVDGFGHGIRRYLNSEKEKEKKTSTCIHLVATLNILTTDKIQDFWFLASSYPDYSKVDDVN